MKIIRVLVATVGVTLASGCDKSNLRVEGSPATGPNFNAAKSEVVTARKIDTNAWQEADVSASDYGGSAKASAESFMDNSFAQRSACVVQAVGELDSLDQKIRQLSDKLATAGDSVKIETRTKIIRLSDQRVALNQKLAALQKATPNHWDEAKTEFKKADDKAKISWRQTWQWLTAKLSS